MMTGDALLYLRSEKLALTRLLERTPLDQVIERTGFEHRLSEIDDALAKLETVPAQSSIQDLASQVERLAAKLRELESKVEASASKENEKNQVTA